MNLICYSDLQATLGSETLFADRTQNLQHWRVQHFLSNVLSGFPGHGLLDLGDTLDDRNAIPLPTLDAVLRELRVKIQLSYKNCLPHRKPLHFKIIGNHEQYLRDGSVHCGEIFSSLGFRVFAQPERIELDGTALIFLPFNTDYSAIASAYKQLMQKPAKKKIVLGHFDIKGAKTKGGGLKEGLSAELFKDADLVLLGHVHKPQQIAHNIHYVGSPFQQNYGEAGEEKRIGILDTDTATVRWVPVTGFPQYYKVDLAGFKDLVQKESEDRFQVILKSPTEAEEFYRHPLSERAVPEYEYTEIRAASTNPIPNSLSMEAALELWVESNPPAKELGLNKEDLLAIGKEMLN